MRFDLLSQAKERLRSLAMLEVAAAKRQEELRQILDELRAEHGFDEANFAEHLGISQESLEALLRTEHVAAPHERLGMSEESVQKLLRD